MNDFAVPRILIIEDSDADQVILHRSFSDPEHAYQLVTAGNIAEALDLCYREPPNLIITDYRLPDGTGIDLIRQVRAFADIPVIILTCYGDEKVVVEAMKAGAYDFVSKSPAAFASIPKLVSVALREVAHRRAAEQDRQHLQHQLAQAQKMDLVGLLAGGIAHDFNNILTGILGYANLFRFESVNPQCQQYIDNIEELANKAAHLTRSLLTFSRKQPLELKLLNLNQHVTDLYRVLQRITPERVILQIEPCTEDLRINADGHQLDQVLMNLVANASHAMREGGRISIATGLRHVSEEQINAFGYQLAPGSYAELTVLDFGSGIPADVLPHIFEPFFSTKGVGEGTGLGLAVVYGIVKNHGGFIDVESTEGRGTCFRVCLPLVHGGSYAGTEVGGNLPRGVETILIIEDDPGVRSILRTTLTAYGYTVIEAVDGAEGLAAFAANRDRIDLVLLDAIMPVLAGDKVYMKLMVQAPKTRVIIMSGYSESFYDGSGVFVGVPRMMKPIRPREILTKLREILDQ